MSSSSPAVSYATPAELSDYAAAVGVVAPANPDALLAAASRDLDLLLHGTGTIDVTVLTADQLAALSRGCCAQALFRNEQGPEATIGEDDQITVAGPVSFSSRPPVRVSPLAVEEVSGHGLLQRSGCAPPPPAPVLLPLPLDAYPYPYWPWRW